MAGVMHIGAGLVGLKSENVHGTRATSEFREPQNLNNVVFGGGIDGLWALLQANKRGKQQMEGRKEGNKQTEGRNE